MITLMRLVFTTLIGALLTACGGFDSRDSNAPSDLIQLQSASQIQPLSGSVRSASTTRLYVVNAGSEILTFTESGKQVPPMIVGLDVPRGIAVDQHGKIYVADSGDNLIKTYTSDGVRTKPTISTGLNVPTHVAVDAQGKIYVSNQPSNGSGYVTTYDANGKETTPIITGLSYPIGIAVDSSGKIYVVIGGNGTVETFTKNGARTKPTISSGVVNPNDVHVDVHGKIYVVNNAESPTITTYKLDGAQTTPTISAGLNQPLNVCVDSAGRIYVTNYGNSTVTGYSPNGSQLGLLIAGLDLPVGIAAN